MQYLRELEDQSVYILREAYKHFDDLAMLCSMGKDSTVLLWLARKAFFGHVPFPLVHINTGYEMPALMGLLKKAVCGLREDDDAHTSTPMVCEARRRVRDSPEGSPELVSGRRGASFEARSVAPILRLGRHEVRVEDDQPFEGNPIAGKKAAN